MQTVRTSLSNTITKSNIRKDQNEISSLFSEAEQALKAAEENFHTGLLVDGIDKAYTAFICNAKALLLSKNIALQAQQSIPEAFEKQFAGEFFCACRFSETVLRSAKQAPTKLFARKYIDDAYAFAASADHYRRKTIDAFHP